MLSEQEQVIDGIVMPETKGILTEPSQALAKADGPKEEVIYDADAEQRVAFLTERRGKMFRVVHIFGAILEDNVLDYERRRSQKLSEADAEESHEQDATAVTSKTYQAALHYWNSTGARAEGYSGKVSDRDKVFAVDQLFGVEFQDLPLAEDDELCPDDDDENSTHILRCLFDGKECYPSATLRPPKPEEIEQFEALQNRSLLVKGQKFGQRDQQIPAKAKRFGEMFDQMKVSVSGYARRVPLHHKAAFALRHLRAEQKAITGK